MSKQIINMNSSWTMSKGLVHIIANDQYCTWTNVQFNLWTWTNIYGQ
ncbi:22117_t:CDS:1, partial [Gigaspora margarita]